MAETVFDIAILGAGFSGTMVAVHLLTARDAALRIVRIERNAQAGPGVAYATEDRDHILNSPAARMSAFDDEPLHFYKWLTAADTGWNESSYVPRKLYGEYLQQLLKEAAIAGAPRHVCNRICAEIKDVQRKTAPLEKNNSYLEIHLDNGQTIAARRAVITSGNGEPFIPPQLEACKDSAHCYVNNPWQPGIADDFLKGDALIVGTGLTALDTILTLSRSPEVSRIYAVSRRGLLPQTHQSVRSSLPVTLPTQPSLRKLLRVLREAAAAENATDGDWLGLINGLRPRTQQLWQGLTFVEQQRFLRHLRPYWEVYRHRVAPEISERISQLQSSGRLRVIAGRIVSLRTEDSGRMLHVQVTARGKSKRTNLQIRRIVNCTGVKPLSGLVLNLIASGLALPDRHDLGLQCNDEGFLLEKGGRIQNDLCTLGPLRLGSLWETLAVPELRLQAKALAMRLLEN